MNNFRKNLFSIAILLLINLQVYSQCRNFARSFCKDNLKPYIHDGNYSTTVLSEGTEAELFRTFNANQKYKVTICHSHALPKIQFQILDKDRNILYDNGQHNLMNIWDFMLSTSQTLTIKLKVPFKNENENAETISAGCVAVLFGISRD